jgi:hypothetical protein
LKYSTFWFVSNVGCTVITTICSSFFAIAFSPLK